MENKLKLLLIAMIAFNAFVVTMMISIYFKSNPIGRNITRVNSMDGNSLFPQGWAFFTKSSKTPRTYMAEVSNGKIKDINFRNCSAEFYFGLNRKNRLMSIQMGNILEDAILNDSTTLTYHAPDIHALYDSLDVDNLIFQEVSIAQNLAPYFEGNYVVVNQRMLPWSMLHRKIDYPSEFAAIPIHVKHIEEN